MGGIRVILESYSHPSSHDDLLFHILLLTAFFALMCLEELACMDDHTLDVFRKLVKRNTLQLSAKSFQFELPYHKADRFFGGNTILICANNCATNPVQAMAWYVLSWDRLFQYREEMWLQANSNRLRRRWFLNHLYAFSNNNVGGHSLQSGGATTLAQMGVYLDIIQAMGRWSGNAFRSYIRLHNTIQQHQRSL